jgi:DNA repair protein RecO (recombination protein O)
MKRFNTTAIVLARTDFGEADRILTLLTPDHGKLKAIAKGVRKSKSKMAGGIELFSVSEISFIAGRSEINTLISTRLVKHYGSIVKDLGRTNLTYEIIKTINKATQEQPEEAYFNLLKQAFEALDDAEINLDLVSAWFHAQLLKLAGYSPNLRAQKDGTRLEAGKKYDFSFEAAAFQPGRTFNSDHIKFLRLLFSGNSPKSLQKINGSDALAAKSLQLLTPMLQQHLHL